MSQQSRLESSVSTASGKNDPERKSTITPMMAQYQEIKKAHPDCLLFFRMGDFYELFFDDAVAAAGALDITLTQRGKHQGTAIPMCGVPFHAYESYLARLIRQGFRVAVCEQIEDPVEARKRPGKPLVKRDVVRVVTPGTLTEETLLEGRQHNFLSVLYEDKKLKRFALAAFDLSTRDFFVESMEGTNITAALAKYSPSEVVVPEKLLQNPALFELFHEWKKQLRPLPDSRFDPTNSARYLREVYKVDTFDGFGTFEVCELTAAGALLDYVKLTQKGDLPHLEPPRKLSETAHLKLDAATLRNLELMVTLSGERKGSLLTTLDRTMTHAGGRLFARWLMMPLMNVKQITDRLEGVEFLVNNQEIGTTLRDHLKHIPDIERSLSRLTLNRGGPRDLAAIREGLRQGNLLQAFLKDFPLPSILAHGLDRVGQHEALIEKLTHALSDTLPLLARDGGFIAPGYHDVLDQHRSLRDEARTHIATLQKKYQKETGVNTLKIKQNNILGHYVEVSAAQSDKLPDTFIHRQTLSSGMRYTTLELSELEQKIVGAAAQALALEQKIFENLAQEIKLRMDDIAFTARILARLDVLSSFALLAIEQNYCRPKIDTSQTFEIIGGRHPVVERALKEKDNQAFVANDCRLDEDSTVWLLTGPNMAGKSTFLRQNALFILMAQMGSFVPAKSAHLGVVDRLFSRVGAADDLARGRSTFMVEMVETAAILNQATDRSFVILDEVGRGTSTYDGVSIAWATVEHLHNVTKCRALFATHYHELTVLEDQLPHLNCHTIQIKEWDGKIVFLHKVTPGAADRSYGIHVAELAGLPRTALQRAQTILKKLEKNKPIPQIKVEELPLFAHSAPLPATEPTSMEKDFYNTFQAVSLDELSPKQALELLYEWRESFNKIL